MTAGALDALFPALRAAAKPWCGAQRQIAPLPTRSRPAHDPAGAKKSTGLAKTPCRRHDPTRKKKRPVLYGPLLSFGIMNERYPNARPQAETRSALIVLR